MLEHLIFYKYSHITNYVNAYVWYLMPSECMCLFCSEAADATMRRRAVLLQWSWEILRRFEKRMQCEGAGGWKCV